MPDRSALRAAALVAALLFGVVPAATAETTALEVRRGSLTRALDLAGTLTSRRAERYTVPVTNSWRITIKWLAEEGSAVAPGDPVARLDTANLEAEIERLEGQLDGKRQERALKEAAARREGLQLELKLAQAENTLAKARLDAAVPEPMVGAKSFDERRVAVEKAEAALGEARVALDTHAANLAAALERLDLEIAETTDSLRLNRERVESLTLRATVSGIVIYASHPWMGRKIRVGDNVRSTEMLVEIPDSTSLEAEAFVSETDAHLVAPGQEAELRLDAYPERAFTGRVRQVNPAGEEREAWGASRYFRILLDVDGIDTAIMKPGMSVRCGVVVDRRNEATLVPIEAVFAREARFFVTPEGGEALEIEPLAFDRALLAVKDDPRLPPGRRLEVPGGVAR